MTASYDTSRIRYCLFTPIFLSPLFLGCSPVQNSPTEEIVLYNWEGDLSQTVRDRLTSEYKFRIRYEVYESQEEVIENIRNGLIYDVVIMESRFVLLLVGKGLLAKLDYQTFLTVNTSRQISEIWHMIPEIVMALPFSCLV